MITVDLNTGLDIPDRRVKILYTNWEGKVSWRMIEPHGINFESSEWHPAPQWVLHAYDVDKQAMRGFALKDIHKWEVVE